MELGFPEFEILEESNSTKSIKFIIKNVDVSIVNGIRRIIISEIPCGAIPFNSNGINSSLNIKENVTMMDNEYLSNRISLIPLNFTQDEIENYDKEKYKFVLKKKNTSSEVINITSADFVVYDNNNKIYDNSIKDRIFEKNPITKDNILITKLKPNLQNTSQGNSIHLEAYAEINIGKHHARWQPTSNVSFFNQIDEKKADKIFQDKLQNSSPQDAELLRQSDILDRQRCFKTDKKGNCNEFQFYIESLTGNLNPKYLFSKALDIFLKKIESLLLPDKFKIESINSDFFLILFDDERYGYDVLQLLIRSMNNDLIGKIKITNDSTYAGYYQQHPLDDKMILKVKLQPGIDFNEFFMHEVETVIKILQKIKESWSGIS